MDNLGRQATELKMTYGRSQMKLYKTMVERGGWPLNDCQLYVNIGNIIGELADDWDRCKSTSARVAIDQKVIELLDEMCKIYDGAAVTHYVDDMRTSCSA